MFVSNECLKRFSYKAAIGDWILDTEYCHRRRILSLSLWPGKQKAIHEISSSRFYECKEIQNCSISKKKKLCSPSFGIQGVLYTEFLTEGTTVSSERYCANLRSLKQRISRIRLERNTFPLHHDNARLHCSAQTEDATTSESMLMALIDTDKVRPRH